MIQRLVRLGVVLGLLASFAPVSAVQAQDSVGLPPLAISELQTGGVDKTGAEDGTMEFIELYNSTSSDLNVAGWKVQYLSASGATVTDLAVLSGKVTAQSYMLLSYQDYIAGADIFFGQDKPSGVLAKSGGHIRVIDEAGAVIDLVGWGSAKATMTWPLVPEIKPAFSIKRILPDDPLAAADISFTASTQPVTPQAGGYVVLSSEPEEPDDSATPAEPQLSCEDIVLSEVLPNAAGSDTAREFIELHNPTDEEIDLAGCTLQLASNSKTYTFPAHVLQPGEYRAFYDSVTNITLPNASGDTVWLVSAANVEAPAVTYPGNMTDDTAWALVDGVWQSTYAPTPNAANIAMPLKPCAAGEARSAETGQCQKTLVATAAEALAPCKEGQERNPATNRCRTITTAVSTLTPCKAGQERNPETNRCRSVLSASTTLTPCAADQERNPETNRCRKITSATLAACKAGQVRNAETNRCRKVVASSNNLANVKDVESGQVASKTGWYVAGAVILAATAYAIYEWRQEILQRLKGLKN